MNILPKKRWHVRTRENIARVRRDEAKAAEEEKERQRKIHQAEQEVRLTALRKIAASNLADDVSETSVSQSRGAVSNTQDEINERIATKRHINFFKDLEDGHAVNSKANVDHQREEKEEKEKYEKQIGYLTYLGQDTNEALRKQNWYNVHPSQIEGDNVKKSYDKIIIRDKDGNQKPSSAYKEVEEKRKQWQDPLSIIKTHFGDHSKRESKPIRKSAERKTIEKSKKKKKKKHKKRRKERGSESESSESSEVQRRNEKLDLLRKKRLERERIEREREKELIFNLSGNKKKTEKESDTNHTSHRQVYNSQFNPEIARQNYSNNYS